MDTPTKLNLAQVIEGAETAFGKGSFWVQVLHQTNIPMFVVGPDREIVFWSRGMERLSGFPPEDMLGSRCCESERCGSCLTNCDLFVSGVMLNREAILCRKDGTEYPVRKHGVLMKDSEGRVMAGVEFFDDITEEVHIRQKELKCRTQLESNKKLVESVIDTISDGAVGIDNNFTIVSFSRQAAEMTGIPVDQAVGQKCYELIHNPLCSEQCPVQLIFKTGNPHHEAHTRLQLPSGETLRIIESAVPLMQEGHQRGSVLLLKDLSLQEMLGREMFKQNRYVEMVGRSKAMQEIFFLIEKLSDIDAAVLIRGESGTGRAIIAQTIHRKSVRSDDPFRTVDCGLIPPPYLESEFFGHLEGAVPGGMRDRIGEAELADRGTIYVVHVEQLPLGIQEKLTRMVKEGYIIRVGGTQRIRVNTRLVVGAELDLDDLSAEGKLDPGFREILGNITISIPPLRERISDIELLVAHFLSALSASMDPEGQAKKLSASALRALIRYQWPKNVRELHSVLEYAVAVCSGPIINLSDLPPEILRALIPQVESGEEDEKTKILKILEDCHWRRSDAAQKLQMDRTTLWRKMKAYGLG